MYFYAIKIDRFVSAHGVAYEYGGRDTGFPAYVLMTREGEWGCCKSTTEIETNGKIVEITEEEFETMRKEISDIELAFANQEKVTSEKLQSEINDLKMLMADIIGGAM